MLIGRRDRLYEIPNKKMIIKKALYLLLIFSLLPSATSSKPRFKPTKAHKDKPRVATARNQRTEDIRKLFADQGLDYPPQQVLLRAFKQDKVLELWVRPKDNKQFIHLKNYAICAASGTLGPKRQRGDLQVPEGYYRLSWFNSQSDFLLSLKVNYPNPSDRLRAKNKDPGGSIFIHGSCVTIGCIPLTDRWIEELYVIALDTHWRRGTKIPIHIFPTRLDDDNIILLKKEYATKPELIRFWEELKPGYDYFEKTKTLAKYVINKNGAYKFRSGALR
jgi:murein L,D-transpeptidase YafK